MKSIVFNLNICDKIVKYVFSEMQKINQNIYVSDDKKVIISKYYGNKVIKKIDSYIFIYDNANGSYDYNGVLTSKCVLFVYFDENTVGVVLKVDSSLYSFGELVNKSIDDNSVMYDFHIDFVNVDNNNVLMNVKY